jgi:hypothetical protein
MRRSTLLLLACAGIGLTGCYSDPFQNPADWSMNGAPRENIAQQVADPSELLQGHGETTSNGVAAAAGVDLAIGGAAGTATGLQKAPSASNIFSFTSGS